MKEFDILKPPMPPWFYCDVHKGKERIFSCQLCQLRENLWQSNMWRGKFPIWNDNLQKVLLFSGGRTSGYMLHRMLKSVANYREKYLTIFCNTGKERPETLDFVHQVETRWVVPIIWLEYNRISSEQIPPGIFPTIRRNQNLAKSAELKETTHWFTQVTYETASRKGEPFDKLLAWMTVLPNVVSRGCSMQLKIRTAMRYLFSKGFKEYASIIGIRGDESGRAVQILSNADYYEHPVFPLVNADVDEAKVLHFWSNNDFDLQLKSHEGNCDLCFLKAKWKRIMLMRANPGMAEWWKNWEERKGKEDTRAGSFFRMGEPYAEIEKLSRLPNSELNSRLEKQLNDFDIPCSCAERAFGSLDEL